MKRFNELLNGNESRVYQAAGFWCDSRIKYYPEDQWLQWAKNRLKKDFLLDVEGFYLEKYFKNTNNKEFKYSEFIAAVIWWCDVFIWANDSGEMTPAQKRLSEKMQAESGYTPAREKENPDTSPEKIQLELEDGVAYISKKSGWVLSQF